MFFLYFLMEQPPTPSVTGPANCSIFGLHIHTHSYARLHTLTPSVKHTHSLTHWRWGHGAIELFARAAADIIVLAEGRRFHQ